ncbi:alpha/beta hydrolase [Defluviimonas sp. WL0050]|uniref:Alpha/beta hydrolase n=1 Tax=Albidovulum litorale TaxID=2984134 RepID=A0ABT2ZKI5_9RHOB|nr:alpha/beta hydrolase [Defluviimonas sp. WL0050]MCV2871641.1 alpha/beta hydrolase [Defluviimonas sp. WL0050]
MATGTAQDGTVYDLSGPEGAPTVVLIHGLGLNRACWQWLVPELAGRYRVLAYDLLGHGESGPPPPDPVLKTLADQLAGLLDHLGLNRAAIVGFSLGGMIARRFAHDHPERVTALGILHSPHERTPEAQAAILARVEQAKAEGPSATVEAALVRWFTDAYRAANPQMMDLVRSWVMANDPAIYPQVYRILATGIHEIVAQTPPITVPALVITGDEDYGNGPEMTRAIAAEIAGAEALILPGLRHMALAEDPAAVNRPLIAFLDRHLGAQP